MEKDVYGGDRCAQPWSWVRYVHGTRLGYETSLFFFSFTIGGDNNWEVTDMNRNLYETGGGV